MSVYDTQNETTRDGALQAAADAVRAGRLIVLPTDTVYGIGADAFTPEAVQDLLSAKGRGRDVPPPVLVGDPAVLHALAVEVPDYAEDLTDAFWPGALTLILRAQPSLSWDLGETGGTVALRMPDDETALSLLRRTGPLAVSSANRHGRPASLTVMDAASQLGDTVDVYLDGGPARIGTSSTIIDATVEPPEIVREGALTRGQIIAAVGDIFTAPEPEVDPEIDAETSGADSAVGAAGADIEGAALETGPQSTAADAVTADAVTAEDAAEAQTPAETSVFSHAHDDDAATGTPSASPADPEPESEDISADIFTVPTAVPLPGGTAEAGPRDA